MTETETPRPADASRSRLAAALGFSRLEPRAPELQLLHRWLDTWSGLGAIAVGMARQEFRPSLSHIGPGEWRAVFATHPQWAPAGYGVAPTPWGRRCRGRRGARYPGRRPRSRFTGR